MLNNGEAEAGAFLLGGKIGVEDLTGVGLGNTGAIISDSNDD